MDGAHTNCYYRRKFTNYYFNVYGDKTDINEVRLFVLDVWHKGDLDLDKMENFSRIPSVGTYGSRHHCYDVTYWSRYLNPSVLYQDRCLWRKKHGSEIDARTHRDIPCRNMVSDNLLDERCGKMLNNGTDKELLWLKQVLQYAHSAESVVNAIDAKLAYQRLFGIAG